MRVETRGFRTRVVDVVTTLLNAEIDTKAQIASLYRQRWHAELDLRSIKVVLGMDVLRCKTPAMVRKEIGMTLAAYNVIRALMVRAAREHDRVPRRLSFKGALQSLLGFAEKLRETRQRSATGCGRSFWRVSLMTRSETAPTESSPGLGNGDQSPIRS